MKGVVILRFEDDVFENKIYPCVLEMREDISYYTDENDISHFKEMNSPNTLFLRSSHKDAISSELEIIPNFKGILIYGNSIQANGFMKIPVPYDGKFHPVRYCKVLCIFYPNGNLEEIKERELKNV